MNKDSRIYVAGHRGLVGSALLRELEAGGFRKLITVGRADLDLMDQRAVEDFFEDQKPEFVFLAAAKVGGIHANDTYPAEFLYDNLMIECNIIHNAYRSNVEKLLFLGSTCIYPKLAEQPLREESLLTGPLEPTNEWYAIAKIAGIKLCQAYRRQYGCDFIAAMPTNLYGPGDNFDLQNSHVLPALIRKFHEAKLAASDQVVVWGSGTPRREFLHVDDCASACLHLMEHYSDAGIVNVGTGEDVTIAQLAGLVAEAVDYSGQIVFDRSKPDGTPRKVTDTGKINALGWSPRIDLKAGLEATYDWYRSTLS